MEIIGFVTQEIVMTVNSLRATILVARRNPGYKDIPGIRYHYPKLRYGRIASTLNNQLVIFYEPRRGGARAGAAFGGRSAFTAMAYVDRIWDDPEDDTHGYLGFRYYLEFPEPVGLEDTPVEGKSLQFAIRSVPYAAAEEIIRRGLTLSDATNASREGLSDISLLQLHEQHPVETVTINRRVRDAAFRYRVVEQAYDGTCALTGLRITNGLGRAEADAAHIRSVAENGPDIVSNGIALTKTIHWAFDRGLVSLGNDGRILIVERGLDDPVRSLLLPNGQAILAKNPADRPHESFLDWHRTNVFKGAA